MQDSEVRSQNGPAASDYLDNSLVRTFCARFLNVHGFTSWLL